MFRLIKKYFISHKENDYQPHLLRNAGVTGLFFLIVFLFAATLSSRFVFVNTDLTALVLPKVLVDYTNQNRDAKKYGHLAMSPVLERAAQLKANDMAEKGYFAHTSPEGLSPWYWFRQAGYNYSYAGENLAVNFSDSLDVSNAWMNSPGHRDNILNSNFTEIGIATAEGMYQGKKTVFVVQLFGTPRKSVATASLSKIATSTKTKTTQTTVASSSTVPKVLAESVSENNELFVAVEGVEAEIGNEEGSPETNTETKTQTYSNFFERALMSPKNTLSSAYFGITLAIILALSSIIYVEIKREHRKMLVMAVSLLLIMFGLLYLFQSGIFTSLKIV